MKVIVERRKYDALVIAVQDAIDDDDKSSLCESVVDCFTDEQSEEIEDSLGEELFDYIGELIDDWDSDDGETLWELIVQKFSDEGITIVISESPESEEEDEEEEEEDEDDNNDDEEEDLDDEDEDSDDD